MHATLLFFSAGYTNTINYYSSIISMQLIALSVFNLLYAFERIVTIFITCSVHTLAYFSGCRGWVTRSCPSYQVTNSKTPLANTIFSHIATTGAHIDEKFRACLLYG